MMCIQGAQAWDKLKCWLDQKLYAMCLFCLQATPIWFTYMLSLPWLRCVASLSMVHYAFFLHMLRLTVTWHAVQCWACKNDGNLQDNAHGSGLAHVAIEVLVTTVSIWYSTIHTLATEVVWAWYPLLIWKWRTLAKVGWDFVSCSKRGGAGWETLWCYAGVCWASVVHRQ